MRRISFRTKRAQLALRFFTYGVMTLATVLLTTLAIFYAMGYRFNQTTLVFEQGGLMQFRSTPDGATVVVDGVVQNFKTPGRVNLPSGAHTIVMQLDGYREWQRTVTLSAGQLLWLNYTRFVPNSISTVPLKTFQNLANVLASPDRRWMLFQEKADSPVFTMADLGNEKNLGYTDMVLPDSKLTKADGKFGQLTPTEWDLSSRYFLIHSKNSAADEWLRVDRSNPENTVNMSQVFGLKIDEAHFSGANPNIVYVRTGDVLRRLDIGANSASASLVNNVRYFTVYGNDTIAFIAKPAGGEQSVGIYKADKTKVIQNYPTDANVRIAFSEYDNHSFLAIDKGDGTVQVLRDPATTSKDNAEFTSFNLGKNSEWLTISNNGRMVVAGTGSTVVAYDIEIGRAYASNLPFLGGSNERPMQWLDDFYMWSDNGGKLQLVEFDGQNDREITTVAPGFDITLSQSGESLFSIGKNASNAFVLQASKLVVKK